MRIEHISVGKNPPTEVNVIVEVPVGGEPIKYEMDKKAGTLVVDRFLYTSMRYPGNYGFVPHTLSDDGDPIDRPCACRTRHAVSSTSRSPHLPRSACWYARPWPVVPRGSTTSTEKPRLTQ